MPYLLSILSAIVLIALPVNSMGQEGVEVYINSEDQFRFNYPADWIIEQPDYEETVVEIRSPDRKLTFNVGVARDISLNIVQPKDFIKRFSKKTIIEMYEKEFADFHLLEARETILCAQPAYYFVYTFASSDADRNQITMKCITVTTNRSEIQYTLTAAGVLEDFDKNRAMLTTIIDSFTTSATLGP